MKTYLTYGFLKTFVLFLLTLVLFVCGLQSDAANLTLGNVILGVASFVISVTFLALGIRARRSAVPASEDFTYGWAFGAGVAVQFFAALLGIVTTYLYVAVINPRFTDIMLQAQADKLQARGMSDDQIERMQHFGHMFAGPGMQAAFGFLGSMIWGVIISLILAAIFRRPASEPPAVSS